MEGHTLITPRSRSVWKEIIESTGSQRVCEIGFNFGHSTRILLELGCDVHSIDINPECHPRMVALGAEFPKFSYEIGVSTGLMKQCDLLFIDGDHSILGIQKDMFVAGRLKPKAIVVDDWGGEWFVHIPVIVKNAITTMNRLKDYAITGVYTYDASDGDNKMGLLERK